MATVTTAKAEEQIATVAQEIDRVFAAQRENRFRMANTTARERIARLRRILQWMMAHRQEIHRALYEDFRKPAPEVDLSEILFVKSEIKHAVRHLKKWMKPRRVRPTLTLATTRAWVRYEPRGVVLIISPWNYPFNLTVGPLVSALAAGNCVILKPSEHTPHTSALLRRMVTELFPENEVALFEGDAQVAQMLLQKPFDHIFFTGSPRVGKIVMKAAAEHLSTVTLELGGKSPVIIDETANIKDAAEKVAWGKFVNDGQTCIAPDYLLVHRSRYQPFLEALRASIARLYGETTEAQEHTPDYARIVNEQHLKRLLDLLDDAIQKGAQVEVGGIANPGERFIAPTVLGEVPPDSRSMQEEIFGPLLPVLPYGELSEALKLINEREKPLALYIFSRSRRNIRTILQNTTAGGTCINEVAVHYLHSNLPFGGVNTSGFGNSHGFYGFRAFSHERAVLKHSAWSPLKLLYPPYTKRVQRLIDLVVRYL